MNMVVKLLFVHQVTTLHVVVVVERCLVLVVVGLLVVRRWVGSLVPDAQETVPGARAHGHAVLGHAQTADAIVMTGQNTRPFRLHGVPDVTVEVVVAGQEEPAALTERDGRNSANDIVVTVHGELLVRPHIKQPTGGVVAAGRERLPIREERDRVDVRLVAGERLLTEAVADVPQFGARVARARYEGAHVGRQGEGHYVTRVA